MLSRTSFTCPFQTPLSTPICVLAKAISRRLCPKVRNLLQKLRHRVPGLQADTGHIQPTNTEQPPWSVTYGPADLRASKRGALCISESISHHATDNSVIYRSAQFAINLTLYPQTADILSPSILADHFFGYLAGKQATPGWLNHMNTIGLALALILSVQLCTDPRNQNLRCLSF